MKNFKEMKYLLLDLDGVCYGKHNNYSLEKVFGQVSQRMTKFISERLKIDMAEAKKLQTDYFYKLFSLKSNFIMRLIIIPQALRVIIPPLTSQYLNLTKNSSLGIAIGYADLVHGFGGISLNQTGRAIEIMVMVMLTYLTISLTISLFMNLYNKSVQFKGNA